MLRTYNGFSADEFEPIIYRYHSFSRPDVNFGNYKDDGKNLFMGFELEFDTRRKYARPSKLDVIYTSNCIFGDTTTLYYMLDGSLNNGLEMITQPRPLSWHLKNRDKYTELFEAIKEAWFGADRYKSTGFHVHVNRSFFEDNEEKATVSILYIVEKFKKELAIFSRRNLDQLNHYASFYYDDAKTVYKNEKDTYNERGYHYYNRYKAINLNNNNTIEFRFFKSSLKPEIIFSYLQLVYNITFYAKYKTSEEIQDLKFEDLLTNKEMYALYNKLNNKNNIQRYENI